MDATITRKGQKHTVKPWQSMKRERGLSMASFANWEQSANISPENKRRDGSASDPRAQGRVRPRASGLKLREDDDHDDQDTHKPSAPNSLYGRRP